MPQPDLILTPFAQDAPPSAVDNIPEVRSPSDPLEKATWTQGFPGLTMIPLAAGGIPPRGQDVNGVLRAISEHVAFQGGGGQYKWSAEYVAAKGGYEKGAVIQSDDGLSTYVSAVDGNTINFNTTPGSIGVEWLAVDGSSKADSAIQIAAGIGLSGGGNLTANRTLSVVYGTTAGTAAQGNDPRFDTAAQLNAPIATVAAAGTINLTTGAPNTSQLSISGTGVSINGFTVAANRFFAVKMTGANTLVNSASLVTGSGANIATAAGDSFLMRSTAANTVEVLIYFRAVAEQVLHIQDRKAAGTGGGTFTSGADRTRDLNTVIKNTITGASLSSNQITLPAGTYRVEASCAAYAVGQTRAKIVDVSGPSDLLVGPNARANNDTGIYNQVSGEITLLSSTVIELRHRCTVTKSDNGFGRDCNFGSEQEIYSDIFIERIS